MRRANCCPTTGLFGLLLSAQQLQECDVAVVRTPFGLSRRIVGAASGTVRGVAGAEIWTPSHGNPSAAGWLSIISCSLLASGNAAKALEASSALANMSGRVGGGGGGPLTSRGGTKGSAGSTACALAL